MKMIHQDGGAVVAEIDKQSFTPDADGVYDIPDGLADQARAMGFVDAPPADPQPITAAEVAAGAATVDIPIDPPATVPMRAPDDLSSVSHAGQDFAIPSDRVCAVPVDAVEQFRGMGFTDVAAGAGGAEEELVAMKPPVVWSVPASSVAAMEKAGFTRL